jgi:hypothetical protein
MARAHGVAKHVRSAVATLRDVHALSIVSF